MSEKELKKEKERNAMEAWRNARASLREKKLVMHARVGRDV